MKAFLEWVKSFLTLLGFVRKQIHAADEVPIADWNPFLTAAVEREHKRMIEKRLRAFFQNKPRPWISPNARATALRKQRENARKEIEKRLHSPKGIQ